MLHIRDHTARLTTLAVGALICALAVAVPALATSSTESDATAASAASSASVDWDALVAENPDDPFVASYVGTADGEASGSAAGDGSATSTLVATHAAAGLTCAACHGDDAEVAAVVGTLEEVPESSTLEQGTREFCLSCHDWDDVKDSVILEGDVTVYNPDGLYNVHDNHRGDVDCAQCHSMHETSTLVCVTCHYMELPEGWDGFY